MILRTAGITTFGQRETLAFSSGKASKDKAKMSEAEQKNAGDAKERRA